MSEELQSLVQIIELYGRVGKSHTVLGKGSRERSADCTGESITASNETSLCQ